MAKIKFNGSAKGKRAFTVSTGGSILATPFLLMILLGAIHSAYHNVPALGFKVTWFIAMCLLLIGRYFRGHSKDE